MPRQRTGQLILRPTGYYARLWTTIDGERVRVSHALGTKNKAVARRKLDRLLAAESATSGEAKRVESFTEVAERFYAKRIADRPSARGPKQDLASLRRYALPLIGHMDALAIQPYDVNAVLDAVQRAGKSQQTVIHVKQQIANVFVQMRREGSRRDNPAADATLPTFNEVKKERAVLTDTELALYLAWAHPNERAQCAVRERQTMACVARMFGGLRTGDLHALRWESLDTTAFEWGYAPRQKTRRPQLLGIPAMLRPFLRDWWERQGRPQSGVVFPARRPGKRGDRVGQQRIGVSHAAAFRRDLQHTFRDADSKNIAGAPKPDSRRWQELFKETEYTLPVDFHSWRRAFVQALADADVNAQKASALAGHASLDAHARYLRNAGKLREIPAEALPDLDVFETPVVVPEQPDEKAPRLGSDEAKPGKKALPAGGSIVKSRTISGASPPTFASHAAGRGFESRCPLPRFALYFAEFGATDSRVKRHTAFRLRSGVASLHAGRSAASSNDSRPGMRRGITRRTSADRAHTTDHRCRAAA
jgi:site-specific recombinase XerD